MSVSDIFNTLLFGVSAALLGVAIPLAVFVHGSTLYNPTAVIVISSLVTFLAAATHMYSYATFIVPSIITKTAVRPRTKITMLALLIVLAVPFMAFFTVIGEELRWLSYQTNGGRRLHDQVEKIKALFNGTEPPPPPGSFPPGMDWKEWRLTTILYHGEYETTREAATNTMSAQLGTATLALGWILFGLLFIGFISLIVPSKIKLQRKADGISINWSSPGRIALPEDEADESQPLVHRGGEQA